MCRTFSSTVLLSLVFAAFLSASAESWRSSAVEMRAWAAVMGMSESRNAVFSPSGFLIALGALGEGTSGDARYAIADALGITTDFGTTFSALTSAYAAASVSNRVALSVSTSLWVKRLRDLRPDYRRTLLADFRAECGPLASPETVNALTEVKTDGRITNVVAETFSARKGLLVNAVAFEGAWRRPFDPRRTKTVDFTRADGTRTPVKTFGADLRLVRVCGSCYRAVCVPFAAPGRSMIYVLPESGVSLAALRQRFADDPTLMDGMKLTFREGVGSEADEIVVSLVIPEMTVDSRWNATGALNVFDVPQSGFSRAGDILQVDELRLADWIRVTDAHSSLQPGGAAKPSAATVPGLSRDRRRRNEERKTEEELGKPQESFVCDRPFLFFVWDEGSNSILLAGQFTAR